MIHRLSFLGLSLMLGNVRAHDHDHEDHHHHHHHHHNHNHRHGLRRNLAPGGQSGNLFTPPGKCKDGDESFTVGGVTYECQDDFNEKGGQCRTAPQTEEQKIKFDKDFAQWKKAKKEQKEKKGRQLDGCGSSGCAGINWETDVITIPTWFHVIHNGATGRKFTCDFSAGSGPFTDSDCSYVRDSILVMNEGFRGTTDTLFPQQVTGRLDTKIQFCIAGVKNVDNSAWYTASDEVNMKSTLDEGGMETLNVYVNDGGGSLGYAYYPQSSDFSQDGVVIVNDSMPNARNWQYAEGDTLTHEVGHWLNLAHTHDSGCNGVGDYMDDAGGVTSNERSATYSCDIGLDNCSNDGGVNPIHSFMSYVPDSCMTEFSAGQALRMQAAYEIYRYNAAISNQYSVAADGYSCAGAAPTTPPPTPAPTPEPTCDASLKKLQVDILTDDYPGETSWELVNTCTNQVEDTGPQTPFVANTQYSNNWCLPEAQYRFTINDSFGDGICCGYGTGSYSVTWDGSALVNGGGQFASSESTTFGSCATPPPTPPPTPSPTTPNPTANPTTANPTTANPTPAPTTANPTANPTTAAPTTAQPTNAPTTAAPTPNPTSAAPTNEPTPAPTNNPTTAAPTTAQPTNAPTTAQPTPAPSPPPTPKPTIACVGLREPAPGGCPNSQTNQGCCSGQCWKNGSWAGLCK